MKSAACGAAATRPQFRLREQPHDAPINTAKHSLVCAKPALRNRDCPTNGADRGSLRSHDLTLFVRPHCVGYCQSFFISAWDAGTLCRRPKESSTQSLS
jgi:hypothetical protein